MSEIHVGDMGTVFRHLVTDSGSIVDLSTATSLSMCFLTAAQTTVTVAATFTNSGTDGLMEYTVVSSEFLDTEGEWSWQGKIYFGSASPVQMFHTNTTTFEVFANICL